MTIYVKGVTYVFEKCSHIRNVLRFVTGSGSILLRSKQRVVEFNVKE